MPKMVGKVRIGAPKVGERPSVFRSIFGRAKQTVSEPLLRDDGRLGIMERYVKSKANKRAIEHGRLQQSEKTERELMDDEVLRGMAEEMFERIYDPKRNGMMSRRMVVDQDVIDDYIRWTESNGFDQELVWMKEYGRSPFEYFLDLRRPDLYSKWLSSPPAWEGYGRAGEVPKRRVRRYERIWDALSDSERSDVARFAIRNGLPVQSVVQMLSPEFYKFLKKTGTPYLRIAQDGNVSTTTGKAATRLGDISHSTPNVDGFGVEYEMPYKRGKHKFEVSDLINLENNMQFVGNDYGNASGVVNSGAEGWIGGNGYVNPGVWYGTWSKDLGSRYAVSPVGALHRIVVGGRPMIGENYGKLNRNGGSAWDYERLIGEMGNIDRIIDPERVTTADLDYVRGLGYDYYGDFGIQNQFVDNRPNFVKNLIGNVGSFNTKSSNWYRENGGTVESTKDIGHLARLFGFDKLDKINK